MLKGENEDNVNSNLFHKHHLDFNIWRVGKIVWSWTYKIRTLTHKWLETHGCLISTLVTAALALKHQAISTHSAEQVLTVLDQFHKNMLDTQQTNLETDITFLKKLPTRLRVKQQY